MEVEGLKDRPESPSSTSCGQLDSVDEYDDYETDEPRPDVMGPNGPRMLAEMCGSCIMRPANDGRIDLRPGRLRDLIEETRRRDSYVICHSTIRRPDVAPAICRGFADRYSTNFLRVMGRLGGFDQVPVPGPKPVGVHFSIVIVDRMVEEMCRLAESWGWVVIGHDPRPLDGRTFLVEFVAADAPAEAEGKTINPTFTRDIDGTVSIIDWGVPDATP